MKNDNEPMEHGWMSESAIDRPTAMRKFAEMVAVEKTADAILANQSGGNSAVPDLVATLDPDRIWADFNKGKATTPVKTSAKVDRAEVERRINGAQ